MRTDRTTTAEVPDISFRELAAQAMTAVQLKEKCRARGLEDSGNKSDLIRRLSVATDKVNAGCDHPKHLWSWGANATHSYAHCGQCDDKVVVIDKATLAARSSFCTWDTLWADTTKMTIDTGCRRSVGGTRWHARLQQHLAQQGLKPVYKSVDETFRFGDGQILPATMAWLYPVGVNGRHGEIEVAQVEVPDCPGLLSQYAARQLGLVLNFSNMTLDVKNAGVTGQPLDVGRSRHTMVDLTEFDDDAIIPIQVHAYHIRRRPESQAP